MNLIRRRWWLAAALLLLVLVLLFGREADGTQAGAELALARASAGSAASAAMGGETANPWALVAKVSAEADQAEADALRDKAFLLDPRNDASWCQRGPSQVAVAKATRAGIVGGRAAVEALEESSEAVLQRWAAKLGARPDAASRATADLMLATIEPSPWFGGVGRTHAERKQVANARLLESALREADAYVSWAAAQANCSRSRGPECARIAQRWRQIEPSSLDMRVLLLAIAQADAPPSVWKPLLMAAAEAKPGPGHRRRYLEIIGSLMEAETGEGLRSAAELQVTANALTLDDGSGWFEVDDRCRWSTPAAERTEALNAACRGLADLLERETHRRWMPREHVRSLAQVGIAIPSPGLQARLDNLEASVFWEIEQRDFKDADRKRLAQGRCEGQADLRQRLLRLSRLDARADMAESLRAQGLDPASYLAQRRESRR